MSEKDIYTGTIAGIYVVAAVAGNGMTFVDFYNEKPADIEEVESDACLEMVPEQAKSFAAWMRDAANFVSDIGRDVLSWNKSFCDPCDTESREMLEKILRQPKTEAELQGMLRLAEALVKGGS